MQKLISIIIPFLNERDSLPLLYQRMQNILNGRDEAFSFIFVDDGSTDESANWVAMQAKIDSRVRLLQLSRNFGHQIAITAGLDHADGDAAVIRDADLQDPPEVIPELLAEWYKGVEVVYAVRRTRKGEPFFKRLFAAAFYRFFSHVTRLNVPVDAGDFRLLDHTVVHALRQVHELHRYMRGLTSWVGFRQGAVYYDRGSRLKGETKYPLWRSIKLAFDGLTSFTGDPLRWVSYFGCGISLLGILWLASILWGKIMHPDASVAGWTSIIAALLITSGVQLITLGLLGQYVSRTYEESKKRPLYFVRQ